MRRAAGVFLRPAMEQGGIGERGAGYGCLASVTQQRRPVGALAIEAERGPAGDAGVRCRMAAEPDAVAVEQADARLLHDFGGQGFH